MAIEDIVTKLRKNAQSSLFKHHSHSTFHCVEYQKERQIAKHYFAESPNRELILLTASLASYRLPLSKTMDYAYGFCILQTDGKPVTIQLSPVLYTFLNNLQKAIAAGENYMEELIKYIGGTA